MLCAIPHITLRLVGHSRNKLTTKLQISSLPASLLYEHLDYAGTFCGLLARQGQAQKVIHLINAIVQLGRFARASFSPSIECLHSKNFGR